MNYTTSLGLSLQFAAQEAVAGGFLEIEPEHLLMGLLKLAELPVKELPIPAHAADVVQHLHMDVERLGAALRRRNMESTRLRRKLRSRLGRGKAAAAHNQLHRSPASRKLFQDAAAIAQAEGADGILAIHLLDAVLASPTPLIRELVQAGVGEDDNEAERSGEVLARCRDLLQLAADGKLSLPKDRDAEIRAMRRVLRAAHRKGVLGICWSLEGAIAAVHGLAKAIQASLPASGPTPKRLIDVSDLLDDGKPGSDKLQRLQSALAEATEATDTIVVLALRADNDPPPRALWPIVESALLETRLPLIVLTTPTVYEEVIAQDRRWLPRMHLMWLRSDPGKEIPKVI